MLKIVLFTLSVIRILICGNIYSLPLNVNRIYTVHWSRKWLLDFSGGKTWLVSFDLSSNYCGIDVKWDGYVFDLKSSFKMGDCLSLLNWIEALILSLLLKLSVNLRKSIVRPCVEYCSRVWSGIVVGPWTCWRSCKNGYISLDSSSKCSQPKFFL